MSFSQTQTDALNAPLNAKHVKTRKQAGRELSYVEGWHAIAEANRIFGFDGWTSETILLQETNRDLVTIKNDRGDYQQWRIGYIAKVRITAGGVSREGTGYGSGMGKPESVGDAVEGAIKEAETDARKRALMTFGNPFGLALYDKEQNGVEHDAPPAESGQSKAEIWASNAKVAINGLRTSAALSSWLADNASILEKLETNHKPLFNTVQSVLQSRKSELERKAA